MSTTTPYIVNSPVSGTTYYADLGHGLSAVTSDGISAWVEVWTGANATGSLVAVTTLECFVYDANASVQRATVGPSGPWNTAHTANWTVGAGQSGNSIKPGFVYTGSTPGSIKVYLQYTTSTLFIPTTPTFTPSSGGPGTSVAITGTRFTDASSVTIAGVAASSFTINTDSSITATVASGATVGPVVVTNAQGSGTSATNFNCTIAYAYRSSVWTVGLSQVFRSSVWTPGLSEVYRSTIWTPSS